MNLQPLIVPAVLAFALFARKTSPLAPGEWGGEHIQLTVTAEGATAELDCAHATIPAPVLLDKKGRFAAKGTWVREHGGPIHVGETANASPARFTGTVTKGRTMKLEVTREEDGQDLGSFELGLGQRARIHKCR
jgi:hypothetical protein